MFTALHVNYFAVTPALCMTPVIPLVWQQNLHPFSLVFGWILKNCPRHFTA